MHAELKKRFPQVAYIDPSVRVYGKVEIAEGSSLWPNTVIRAEGQFVRLGRTTNLQDHVMCIVKGINGQRLIVPGLSEFADKL